MTVCVCADGITQRAGGWSLKNSLYWAWDKQADTNNQKLVSGQCIHASNVAHRSAGEMWNSARTFYKVIV